MGLFKKEDLITYKLEINGMRCSMCESHVNDVVRKNFDVKSVKSSHSKNETIIKTKEELDLDKLKEVIASTGYELVNVNKI